MTTKKKTVTKATKPSAKNVIVRTYSAGVFAGVLKSRKGREVVLTNARRLYYWSGAASLSQLAVDGTSNPANCKFPVAVPEVMLLEAIEIGSSSWLEVGLLIVRKEFRKKELTMRKEFRNLCTSKGN
jgi:hypothetical protein